MKMLSEYVKCILQHSVLSEILNIANLIGKIFVAMFQDKIALDRKCLF